MKTPGIFVALGQLGLALGVLLNHCAPSTPFLSFLLELLVGPFILADIVFIYLQTIHSKALSGEIFFT